MMNIELVPCRTNRNFYMLFAEEYVKELGLYDPEIIWDENTWNRAIWDARFIVASGNLCGFVITEEVSYKNKRPLMYIAEFYIVPDERERRVGVEAVRELVSAWDGDIFLYILENNQGAKVFWEKVEKELGWKRIVRDDVAKERGCELRVYQK